MYTLDFGVTPPLRPRKSALNKGGFTPGRPHDHFYKPDPAPPALNKGGGVLLRGGFLLRSRVYTIRVRGFMGPRVRRKL